MPELRGYLKRIVQEGGILTSTEARGALFEMLEESASQLEIAAFLTAIATRGPAPAELTGFVQALRGLGRSIPLTDAERTQLVDTCGTGGDGRGTFNISTGAALTAAAAGAKVAKHGNRGVTSKCGSADVLEAMGISVELEPEAAAECLRQTGFMFLSAPRMHPVLKRLQPVRRVLGFRTIFNLAGPLSNPAGAAAQVIGVFNPDCVTVVSEALAQLGARQAFIVHGADGLDELTLDGPSQVAEVRSQTVRLFRMEASEAGLAPAPLSALAGGDAQENAAILEGILRGDPGPRRDVVLLNAAAALVAAGLAGNFSDGVRLGAHAIDSGEGRALLLRLRKFSMSHAPEAPEGGDRR